MSESKVTARRGCSIRLFDAKKWFSRKANLVSRIVIARFKQCHLAQAIDGHRYKSDRTAAQTAEDMGGRCGRGHAPRLAAIAGAEKRQLCKALPLRPKYR